MDVVIISPEPGKAAEIGRQLLELAEHPRDVQWVSWPAPGGFSVPLELFRRFDTIEPGHIDAAEEDAEPAQAPRRRGRPRKHEESTDNNTSEEE